MRYQFLPRFERSVGRLDSPRIQRVQEAVHRLIQAFDAGHMPQGLGLTQLHSGLWEVRAGLSDRIIFRRTGDLVEFLLVGSHDEIRRFLRTL